MAPAVERDRGAPMIQEAVHGSLMNGLQVVDLEKGVEQHLDVATDISLLLGDEAPLLGLELAEIVTERREVVPEGLGLTVLVDEDPVEEALAANRLQPARGR